MEIINPIALFIFFLAISKLVRDIFFNLIYFLNKKGKYEMTEVSTIISWFSIAYFFTYIIANIVW